jgi:hypothetical protein
LLLFSFPISNLLGKHVFQFHPLRYWTPICLHFILLHVTNLFCK